MTAPFQRVHSGFIHVRWCTNAGTARARHIYYHRSSYKRVYIRLSVDVYIVRGYKYIDEPCAYIKTRGLRGAMEEVGAVERAGKARGLAVPAVEEWEEAMLDEVVEEVGDCVEKTVEEVLGMFDAVQDKEVAVAEEIENATEEEVAAEVEPATEEGEEDSSDLEADTTGEAVEGQVQQVLGKDAVQGNNRARWRMPY